MNEFNKWVANKEDADFLYGGETIEISEIDIQKLRVGWLYNFSVNDEYGCILQYKNSPAKWIPVPNEHGMVWLKCSECNADYYPSFTKQLYAFCPYCGMRMKNEL
jgi:DNA-directed RNA polymerase subunit RPC12/RpoP